MKRELKWVHRWITNWGQMGKVLGSPQILLVHIGYARACPCSGQAVTGGGSWHKEPGERAFLNDFQFFTLASVSFFEQTDKL